jgi:transketolase
MNALENRILEISHKKKLSHIGSCISCVNIINNIYNTKNKDDIFCLGNSHAALALYVVLESHYGENAEELFDWYGTHAKRNLNDKIYVSGGSLGTVEPIAAGIALADKNKNVYLLSSDGGFMEGACWEVLRFKSDFKLRNLIWFVNCNGYGAYCKINTDKFKNRVWSFDESINIVETNSNFLGINGLDSHYKTIENYDVKNK